MIHGVRGLTALVAIVVGLAIAVAIEPSDTSPVERSLLANFQPEHTVALHWTRPALGAFEITRKSDGTWTLVGDTRIAIERRTVETVLATLRGARWHRRASAKDAGAVSVTLTVRTADHQTRAIGIGDSIQGADQTWVTVDRQAYLVDSWVARTLAVDMFALRGRHPLDAVASGETPIRIVRDQRIVELLPRPWRDHRGNLAPGVVDRLISALSQLQLVRVPPAGTIRDTQPSARTTIVLPKQDLTVEVGGQCPGAPHLVELVSSNGDGCVESERWDAVLAALAEFDRPLDQIVDRRPVAGDPATIKLPDGTIHIDGRPTLEVSGSAQPADPARVNELRAALATEAAVVSRPPGSPHATIEVALRSGVRVVLSRYGATFVRNAEPMGLHSSEADVIGRPIAAYIDPTRWMEDANSISALEITVPVRNGRATPASGATDRATFVRGPVIGEWIRDRQHAPAAHASLVEHLAHVIAELRAPRATFPPQWTPICTVSVTFAPPVGAPTTHRLELGSPAYDGCLARIDGVASLAPLALCKAAMAVRANL